jgi:pSer/pThr/pTyr-binding forkhead associated (FHA) protein
LKVLERDKDFSEINLLEKFKVKGNSEESTITVGRAIDQDISLYRTDVPPAAKAAVSRAHAELKYILEEDGNYSTYIRDVKSTNGTFVNSKRISNVFIQLNDGDEIVFGGNSAIKEGEDESDWKLQGKVLLRAFSFSYSVSDRAQRQDRSMNEPSSEPARRLSQTSLKAAAEDTTAISESQSKKARQLHEVPIPSLSPKAAIFTSSPMPVIPSSSSSSKVLKQSDHHELEKVDDEPDDEEDDIEMDSRMFHTAIEDLDEIEIIPAKLKNPASLKLQAKAAKLSGAGSSLKSKFEPPPPIRAAASAATKALAAAALKKVAHLSSTKTSKAEKLAEKNAVKSVKDARLLKMREGLEASRRAKEASVSKVKSTKHVTSSTKKVKTSFVALESDDNEDDEEEKYGDDDNEEDEDNEDNEDEDDNEEDEEEEEEEEEEEDDPRKFAGKASGSKPSDFTSSRASLQASGQPPKKQMKVDGGGAKTTTSSSSRAKNDVPEFEFKFCAGCGRQYTSHVHRFCPECGMKRE